MYINRSAENHFVNRFFVLGCLRWAAVCSLMMVHSAAYAQEATGGAPAEGGKSYGVPWLIIVLVVALGVFITLRPAGRASEIKRDPRAEL
jgi:hypothetical protein